MFDLNELASTAEDGAVMQVEHPSKGAIKGMTITLLGTDTDIFQAAKREVNAARMKRAAKKGDLGEEAEAKWDAENVELLTKVTKSWTGFIRDGVELPCTPDNVRELYSDLRYAWIKDQVNVYVGAREHFFGKSK